MANLERSRGRIPDTQSVKFTFSLIVALYPSKTENKTKNLQHSSQTIALNKGAIFCKKLPNFCKNMLTSAKLRKPWHQKIYFLKLHMCVLKYQNSSFQHNSNEFQTGGGNFIPPSTSKRTPKKPTQIRLKVKEMICMEICTVSYKFRPT